MTLRIVPHLAAGNTLELWAGSDDAALAGEQPIARVGAAETQLEPLEPVFAGGAAAVVSRTVVDTSALSAGTAYDVHVRASGEPERRAGHVRLLPDRLGTRSNPFRVLLASCYSRLADSARAAAPLLRFVMAKTALRPHLKIWCGDQVYLDSPWHHYLRRTHTRAELEARHLAHYQAAWLEQDGLGAALAEGLNVFASDDHELWNNAPFATPIARDTWRARGRREWLDVARTLYSKFQSRGPYPLTFDVGPLSFCVVDTRLERDERLVELMPAQSFARVRGWIRGLRGPGALVLGQPLFTEAARWLKGKLGDYALQNYAQFDELAAALQDARHSIVVLTGDVHYSRVASTPLPSRAKLAEIINSPLALVGGAAGKWTPAPPRLKLASGASLGGAVTTNAEIETADESIGLLEFFAAGSQVVLRYAVWPSVVPGGAYGAAQHTEIVL